MPRPVPAPADSLAVRWKQKEATLFTIQQVAEEFKSESRSADSSAVSVFLEIMRGLLSTGMPNLRATEHVNNKDRPAIPSSACILGHGFHSQCLDGWIWPRRRPCRGPCATGTSCTRQQQLLHREGSLHTSFAHLPNIATESARNIVARTHHIIHC